MREKQKRVLLDMHPPVSLSLSLLPGYIRMMGKRYMICIGEVAAAVTAADLT